MSALRSTEPRGRLVAKPATVAAARQRGLVPAAAPVERTSDIDRPIDGVDGDNAVRPSRTPAWRDPDRDRKFSNLLRDLRATCEAFAEPPQPLAVGIRSQIVELVGGQYEEWLIAKLCRWWTGRPDYLRAVAEGGRRINLDGSQAGEVTASQRAYAAQKLDEWQKQKEAQRAHQRVRDQRRSAS
jgi:hypothetical protein